MSVVLAAAIALMSGPNGKAGAPDRVWGVTLDNVTQTSSIVDALRKLPARATARVVFDPGTTPEDYGDAVREIHGVSDVMGSPVDSAPPSGKMTVDQYRRRMAEFMDGLGANVDIWEVGNEVNGDWTGDSVAMGAKIAAAYEEAKKRQRKTALCLFYSDYYLTTDRDMATWSTANLSKAVREGLDYILVSFYPATADGRHPDWARQFRRLADVFPNAKLGFGELGLRNEDFSLSNDAVKKEALIRRYYRMPSPLPGRFIGGYFWWTFRQDATEGDRKLLKAFEDVVGSK